jgi:diguanylate cyclase
LLKGAHTPAGFDPRRLWLHYALAATIVLGLVAGSALLGRQLSEVDQASGERMLLVERLRMLSQKVLFLARDGAAGADLPAAVAEFERTLERVAGELGAQEPEGGLTASAVRLAAEARSVAVAVPATNAGARAMAALRETGLSALPADLDAIAARFLAETEATRAGLESRHRIVSGIAVFLLLLEGGLVFWPAHRALSASLGWFESQHETIRRQNAALRDRARNLAHSASHDPLTGLTNRKRLCEYLDGLLGLEGPAGRQVCVMHVDLDRFKELNDRLGHATGDAALKRVAEIMREKLRNDDMVSRVGGDEFVIAMASGPSLTPGVVQEIAEDLIRRIRQPMVVNGADIRLGASIGYAFADETSGDADTLIANADIALYEAKRAGKGVARQFTGGMQDRLTRRNAMVLDMERALDAGEFVPYFQPLVALGTGAILGVEMLARWAHPVRGVIHPSDFMDVAEEIGIVDAIDARVLLDGLDALAALRNEGRPVPRLSLNASTRTMRYADYAERLTDAVQARGFPPGDVVVEVLETTLIADMHDQTTATVAKLRQRGFDVYVDDFGTGYSSLLNLASLDVNGLKIDRSLIADIDAGRTRQIVRAIIGLAQAMSLTVVADGIGTARQAEDLMVLGAEAGQGHGIAAPMTAPDLRAWLDRSGTAAGATRPAMQRLA